MRQIAMTTVLDAPSEAIFPGMERMRHAVPEHLLGEAKEFVERDETVKLSGTRGPLADWLREMAREHQDLNRLVLIESGMLEGWQLH